MMNPNYALKPLGQGIIQFSAGASLVVSSGLLKWDEANHKFLQGKSADFKLHWSKFDKIYGRAAMWNLFSTGAELMLKGFLIEEGHLVAKQQNVFEYPNSKKLDDWALKLLKTPYQKRHTQPAHSYGTIASALTTFREEKKINTVARLDKLSSGSPDVFVAAAYELLRDSIRNRDTHAYVPNVRAAHEWLANGMFLRAFNILLGYLESDARTEISKSVMDSRPAA